MEKRMSNAGSGPLREVLDYLGNAFDIPLRDPLWKHVYLNRPFQKLIHSEVFLRLGGIRQLSSATLVYPGSRHTRFEHSIGVFSIARRLLLALLCSRHSTEAEFEPSLHGAKAFLAAALLHDLGHFPYAHVLEGLQSEHEELSARHILDEPLAGILSRELGTDPLLVAALVDETLAVPAEYRNEGLFYRSLLSGTLDPDKLDYLNRDAYYCGVPYGIQDLEYLFSQVHLCRLSEEQSGGDPAAGPEQLPERSPFRICIPEHGLTIIESLIFSRYLMFRTVYWHRNVRALSAPVIESAARALELGLLNEEQIFGSCDLSFPQLFANLKMPEKELCLLAQEPRQFVVADELCPGQHPALLSRLRDGRERHGISHSLCRYLRQRYPGPLRGLQDWQVLLDLTGPKKMQIQDIYVSRPLGSDKAPGPVPFAQTSTVLQPGTLDDFRKSLTMLRLVLPLAYGEAIQGEASLLSDFLQQELSVAGKGS